MKVYLLKIKDYDELKFHKSYLDNILNDIEGNILIKPNILGAFLPEKCVTTHPKFLEWILDYLLNKDVNIVVGDSSAYNTEKALNVSGIKEVCEKYGIKCIAFEKDKSKKVNICGVDVLLPKSYFNADYILNLPKLKTHVLTKFTGAVKNLYGLIPGGLKGKIHSYYPSEVDFCKFLADFYKFINKDKKIITIMDGICALEGNGPSAGNPKNLGVVIASKNPVAVDYFTTYYIGYNPEKILTNRLLKNFNDLVVIEDNKIYNFREIKPVKFKKPITSLLPLPPFIIKMLFNLLTYKPKIVKSKCKRCGICRKVCPVNAITKNYKITNKCIRCYCCFESCPHKAIKLTIFL
ncbi:DUF362 domain-containing protein [Methanocaldococcus indicus]|uniref:DUF362 domain-containing protein n=1 Tax=Methanocaldococcus indicus TaxID=213231 RepID=UPI003C6D72FA